MEYLKDFKWQCSGRKGKIVKSYMLTDAIKDQMIGTAIKLDNLLALPKVCVHLHNLFPRRY